MKKFVTSPLVQKQFSALRNPFFKYTKFFACQKEQNKSAVNLIRRSAPQFSGMSWWKDDFKKISLEDFQGKWICLFFYPLDFTFVCPTEIVDFDAKAADFSKLSTFINFYFIYFFNKISSNIFLVFKILFFLRLPSNRMQC